MDPRPAENPVRVGIGVIGRAGRYLIRQRPDAPGSPMPGVWEFPGGKCLPGESAEACTRRECWEEVGVPVVALSLRGIIRHVYPHGAIELHFYDCETADPRAGPHPSTGFRWVDVMDLPGLTFPGANESIVAGLVAEARARRNP